MPLVNGTLTDFGLDPLTEHDPVLIFEADKAAVLGLNLLAASKPVEVTPAANGYFEVELAATDAITPAAAYTITVRYREPRTRLVKREALPWKLAVPSAGGALADLIRTPSNPANVWIGTAAPAEPTPGTWWLNPETGELSEWS